MSPANRMVRLSPAAALLALSNIVYLTSAHPFAQPQQTRTAEYHELHVQPWPLAPTAAPGFLDDLLGRRQLNTVCGYIGGDPALPATCSAGSHCVVDVDHSAVGCCPDGGACTQGVYTGCVDGSSGAQAEVNPYVFTCQGSDLCYKNSFEGGYSQYGCGSKSGMATTVVGTASGKSAIDLTTISAPITGTAESSSEPTTGATKKSSSSRTDSSKTATKTSATKTETTETDTSSTKVSSTKTSTTDTTTTDTSASSSSETTSTASRSTETDGSSSTSSEESSSSSTSAASAPDTDGDDNGSNNTGAIIGGTISGVAALVALIILGVWLWRRKKAYQGPGLSQKAQAGENGNIQPLLPMREVDESTAPPPMAMARGGSITPVDDFYDDRRAEPYQPHYPYGYGPGSAAGGVMAVGNNSHQMDLDEEPLTRDRDDQEFEDYAEGFHAPLNPIEEESRPNTAAVSDPSDLSNPSSAYPGPRGGGGGPLWQQNRGPGWV
ncbi:hypothetical protein AK830_g6546 [Neonectria ditissima]|uniref:Mid2 domain-containing protein n=1 Tax=Neonectria ditissima TaxID=78410 RepID=A0A0P7AQD0_9HYPO|nr:hypothetical protein AK830_g6546 [Neonectria ditissima]